MTEYWLVGPEHDRVDAAPVTLDVKVTEGGLKLEHTSPDGTLSLKLMVPVKPNKAPTATVQLPEVPVLTFNGFGVTVRLKSDMLRVKTDDQPPTFPARSTAWTLQ